MTQGDKITLMKIEECSSFRKVCYFIVKFSHRTIAASGSFDTVLDYFLMNGIPLGMMSYRSVFICLFFMVRFSPHNPQNNYDLLGESMRI